MHPLIARKNRFPGIIALALTAWLAVSACMHDDLAGSTSTGNTGKIAGRVVDADGKGVAGAKVRVVAADHNPGPGGAAGEVADVVMTGPDGAYRTDSLAAGSYNLLSDKGGLLAFRDSVEVPGNPGAPSVQLEGDTLKTPGTVSGVVRLRPGHDSRTVFLILLGTTTFLVPKDSIGNFKLGPLAEGEYRLRLLSTLDNYRPMDTVVTVRSGLDAVLPDTLRPAYQGSAFGEVPLVDDVRLGFDTTYLRTTLRWARSGDSRVSSYNVYRRHQDSGYVRITVAPQTDTAFTEDWTAGIMPGQTYHYAVTALDAHGNEGPKGRAAVLAMTSRYRAEKIADRPISIEELMDIAPDGAQWQVETDTYQVVRYGTSGEVSRFRDPSIAFGIERLVLDSAGDVYIISGTAINNPTAPLILGKYSQNGIRQWQIQIPFSSNSNFNLHRDGEAVSLWDYENKTLVTFGRDGSILSRDTLRVSQQVVPRYKPTIGFYAVQTAPFQDSGSIDILDLDGRVKSSLSHGNVANVGDIERDADGRWYLLLIGSVQVFSPQHELLGIVPFENSFNQILWRNGGLYFNEYNLNEMGMRRVMRIQPWF